MNKAQEAIIKENLSKIFQDKPKEPSAWIEYLTKEGPTALSQRGVVEDLTRAKERISKMSEKAPKDLAESLSQAGEKIVEAIEILSRSEQLKSLES